MVFPARFILGGCYSLSSDLSKENGILIPRNSGFVIEAVISYLEMHHLAMKLFPIRVSIGFFKSLL
jgi:hypothetical protein